MRYFREFVKHPCIPYRALSFWGLSTHVVSSLNEYLYSMHALEILHLLNIRAWTTNIHLQMIPHVYLAPRSYSALGIYKNA